MAVTFKPKTEQKTKELATAPTTESTATVVVVKKTTKTKKVVEVITQADLEALAKNLAETQEAASKAKDITKDFDALKKKFVTAFLSLNPELNPNDEIGYIDENISVVFSAVSYTRSIEDLKKLHELLGDDFYEVINVSFSDLDKKYNPHELSTFGINYKQGGRTIKSILKK